MAYVAWRKEGVAVTPCRVVGLGVETLLCKMMDVDITCVQHSDCLEIELWKSQCLSKGAWSECGTHEVPMLVPHQMLALYILHRLASRLSGLLSNMIREMNKN